MKTKITYENQDDNESYNSLREHLSKLSLKELRESIKRNLSNDNKYTPFTREWEWDECCNHNVE